jgi:HSP20 family molecular chaperone IbpA
VEHGSGEEARQLMQGALKAAQEVQSQEKELSEEEQEKQHMDSITKFIATKKILGALKYAEDTATQNPEEALNAMNHLMEAFQSAQRDLHQAEQRELESAKAPLPEPQYTIADQADRLVLKATLPELGNMENVVLDGTQDHFSLHAAPHYSLELDLPCSINEDAVQAKFSRKSHVLTVTMPKL